MKILPNRRRPRLWQAIAWLGWILIGAGIVRAAGEPTDPNIHYVGRWDRSDAGVHHSYWGGAYLEVRFTGSTAKIHLGKTTTLLVNIDGTGDRILSNVNGVVDLTAIPLPPGAHTLRVAAQFDEKEIAFKGLILDEGATTLPWNDGTRKLIEFIGDSVTTGADCPYGNGDAYAWHAARMLGADHTQISDPGIALVDGVNAIPGMEAAYWRLKTPNHVQDNPAWNPTRVPDVIVVNLGSNDHYSKCDPARFRQRYVDFLAQLRARYPRTEIFALRLFNGWYAAEVESAVAARIAAGDERVHFVDTTGWLVGYGERDSADYVQKSRPSVHPTQTGHAKVARRLAPLLGARLALP